ncbi:hypothetical protein L1D19_20780 [Vibrio natriegens]|uniref:hypothetical protein n=1 Tax=Vibrio natriegens TaxID=691 RepID=UPI001EFE0C09|nr:hypothetical protein [Vibrio natriegens]MCG9702508.1 hypothetical protein [Vibrio natriegens]
MTDSNAIHSTITKQPKPTTFSDVEPKAASKDDNSTNEDVNMKCQNLNLFIISCSSPCGTYMQAYCQEVLVFAETEAQALELAEKDPTIQYVKGANPEIVGQFEIDQGVAYAHYARD